MPKSPYAPEKTPQQRWSCPKCGASGWNRDGVLRAHQHYSRFGFECNGVSIRKYAKGE